MSDDDLSVLWRRQWPDCPPLADELKHHYRTEEPEPPALSAEHARWSTTCSAPRPMTPLAAP